MRGINIEPNLNDEEVNNKEFLIYMSSYINENYSKLSSVFGEVLDFKKSEENIKLDIFKLLYTLIIVSNK
jgi:hypothetical protein